MRKFNLAIVFCFLLLIISTTVLAASDSTEDPSVIVYITSSGSKYHLSDCGSLWNSKYSITIQTAAQQGYSPCDRCNPPVYTGIIPTEATEPPRKETHIERSSNSDGKALNKTASDDNTLSKTAKKNNTDSEDWIGRVLILLIICIFPTSHLTKFSKADGCFSVLLIYSCVIGFSATALGWAFWGFDKIYFLITAPCCIFILSSLCIICRSLEAKKVKAHEIELAKLEAERKTEQAKIVSSQKLELEKNLQRISTRLSNLYTSASNHSKRLRSQLKECEHELSMILDSHNAVLNFDNLICTMDDGAIYGDSCTVYFRKSGSSYHTKSCKYKGDLFSHIMHPPKGKHPCKYCKPDLIDTIWMEHCIELYSQIDAIQMQINTSILYTSPEEIYKYAVLTSQLSRRLKNLSIFNEDIPPISDSEQPQKFLMTAANGMQVWVPADKLESWKAAQADQSPEAIRRREKTTEAIYDAIVRMSKNRKQD